MCKIKTNDDLVFKSRKKPVLQAVARTEKIKNKMNYFLLKS